MKLIGLVLFGLAWLVVKRENIERTFYFMSMGVSFADISVCLPMGRRRRHQIP